MLLQIQKGGVKVRQKRENDLIIPDSLSSNTINIVPNNLNFIINRYFSHFFHSKFS